MGETEQSLQQVSYVGGKDTRNWAFRKKLYDPLAPRCLALAFLSCVLSRINAELPFGIQGAVWPLEVGLQQFSGSVVVLADRGAGRGQQVPAASCLSRSHPLMLPHQPFLPCTKVAGW